MNLASYLEAQRARSAQEVTYRTICLKCFQPRRNCYCAIVKPFYPGIKFAILLHKLEARRRIATGRMSHLILEHSELMTGQDFSDDKKVNTLLSQPELQPFVLYPGRNSVNLSAISATERRQLFDPRRTPLLFVVDGTWNTARKMIRSRNLAALPRICFSPERPSNFRVRKQPAPGCVSTIEAVHAAIELLGPSRGFNLEIGQHHNLLQVFDWLVDTHVEYVKHSHQINSHSRHHRASQVADVGGVCALDAAVSAASAAT